MVGGTNLAIGISLILRDQFSGRMANARQELSRTQRQALASERAALNSQRNMAASGAIAGAVALNSMREWVKVGANFDKQMVYTYSIADKVGNNTLRSLKDKAIKVGQDTMFSTTQVAGAMTTMAQAGQNTEQIFQNVNSVAVLAAATMSDIETSASAMNDIMIGFNIKATEKNSMHVADVITQSINKSNIQLNDFQESMKYIIPTARTLGMEVEDVATIIASVGNAGIKGSMAGTNTENMFRYLAKAAGADKGKQVEALAALGMTPKDIKDAAGNMLPIAQIVERIGEGLNKMGNVDKMNAMTNLFGVRGQRPALLLANELANYSKMRDKIYRESGGQAQKTANDVMGTLWGGMERLESTWESFKITFTESIEPVLVPLLKVVTILLQGTINFMKQPWGKTLTIIGAGFLLWKTTMFTITTITSSLRLLQLQLSGSSTMLGNNTVTQYNRMSAAANQYGAAATRANAAAGMSGTMGGAILGRNKNGTFMFQRANGGRQIISAAVADRYARMYGLGPGSRNIAPVSNMTRFGNFAGKAAPYAMLGGMALTGAASFADEGSTTQKWLNGAGSTLSMAGTGAMIGSLFSPVGTIVGGVVGGVIGLGMSIYDNLDKTKNDLENAKNQIDNQPKVMNAEWVERTNQILKMKAGSNYIRMKGTSEFSEKERIGYGEWLNKNSSSLLTPPTNNTRVTVNIDGARVMDKTVQENDYTTNVQFPW